MSFKDLLNTCSFFEKRAQEISISIIENDNPLLKELSSFKSFDDRVDFASDNFDKVGEGSSRIVFKFSDDKVIKIAKNEKGIAQNKEESKLELQTEITNRVLLADPSGKWIIEKFANKINKLKFEELTSLDFNDFSKTLHYKFNNDSSDWPKPKNYEDIIDSELFQQVMSLVACNDLQIGDITRIESWGEVDGLAVIMDYGLSRDIYDEFYA